MLPNKKALRREFLSKRAAVPQAERDRISHELITKFMATKIYQAAQIIMAYASTPEELQLTELFAACLAEGKTLAIPLIVGKGVMQAVAVPSLDALEEGAFGIKTVKPPRSFVDPAQIDCVIVPGLAFDVSGGRLGMGGGFYDRFLPLAVNAVKIALAYDFQLVDSLPLEIHDAKIDAILTTERSVCNEVW